MKHQILSVTASILWIVASAPSVWSSEPAKASEPKDVELQGRVVCLPEEMNRVYGTELPTGHEHVYGFRTKDGSYYTLLRTKLSEALFMDERLRKKELLLKGRVLPKSQVFDVTIFKSIVNGKVYDLYYWCDICSIESISPRECACCQGPVELKEKPMEERGPK